MKMPDKIYTLTEYFENIKAESAAERARQLYCEKGLHVHYVNAGKEYGDRLKHYYKMFEADDGMELFNSFTKLGYTGKPMVGQFHLLLFYPKLVLAYQTIVQPTEEELVKVYPNCSLNKKGGTVYDGSEETRLNNLMREITGESQANPNEDSETEDNDR